MNYLELINKVLIKMREEETSSVDASIYVKTIGELVNEAKRSVEGAAAWPAMFETISVTSSSGTSDYSLTGTSDETTINEVIENSAKHVLMRSSARELIRQKIIGSDSGTPSEWAIVGTQPGGELTLRLYPTPQSTLTYSVNVVNPSADLTGNNDSIKCPSEPVVLHAYAHAIKERGEDAGMRFDEALDKYRRTLSRHLVLNGIKVKGVEQWRVV